MLKQLDFEVLVHKSMCFRPPIKNETWFNRVKFMEPLGRLIWPYLGAVYVMVACKRVVPLSLIGTNNVKRKVRVPTGVAEPTG